MVLNFDVYAYPFHDCDDDLDLDKLDYYLFSIYQHLVLMLAVHDLSLNPIHNFYDEFLFLLTVNADVFDVAAVVYHQHPYI